VTTPIPHWPGRMLALRGGGEVWLAGPPATAPGSGEGPGRELVLCVHGMSGAATNWTDLMAELAPDYDCAALDLPGSGFSPPPKTGAGYSLTAHAGTVARLIETLGAGPVHLVGNSMGGAVAVRVAARRPDLVRTLALISPALPDLKVRGSVAHFPVLALPFVGEWLVRRYAARYPVENRVSGVFATCFYDPARVHPGRLALEVEALRRRDQLSYEATSLARAARTLVCETLRPPPFSLWREAAQVTAPSLVVYGSHDRLVNPRLAARAASTFRDALVAVLPETGHLAQMERPSLIAALFREMVGETRARGEAIPEATQVQAEGCGGMRAAVTQLMGK
jgi:pimeloyl-ACP methyl ester carboxylesterase